MSMEKMFEVAARTKMRFSYKGIIAVEDLWDLSVSELDSVFKKLNLQVKQAKEESLLDKKTKEDEVLDTQIEIVKYIVKTKLGEDNARLQAKEQRDKKQKLMAVLSTKQDEELYSKSAADIQKMIDEL